MKIFSKSLFFIFGLFIVGLFLYSYTQVDLSLTLSRISVWQEIEKAFQFIGYFQRPLSTYLYTSILVVLFLSYAGFLFLAQKKRLSRKTLWTILIGTAILLTFSYNAFSYDLFNYIFDAKIVTHYFQNPYIHMALDFPQDPMLSFMHWTQRTYPYGPVWLFVTVPVSFIGLQFFLPTLFLFKALGSVSYLGTAWFIEKIFKKTQPDLAVIGVTTFAFSPLVIIEGLVSAHNDMVMVLFATLAVFFLIDKKYVRSFLLLFLSIGIKFATAVLLPVWILWFFLKRKKDFAQREFFLSLLLLIVPVVLASIRTNFQPWYLLFLFPFVAFFPKRLEIVIPYTLFSFFSLAQYIPFLYVGNWDKPIPFILSMLIWGGLSMSAVIGLLLWGVQLVAKKR